MLLVYAQRFDGSEFLSELRMVLGENGQPCDALPVGPAALGEARGERADETARLVVLGLPTLALALASTFGDRMTLLLDGAEGADARQSKRLARLRVASFSFPLYSALRRAGCDAAFFTWAPSVVETLERQDNLAFVEPGAWPRGATVATLRAPLGVRQFVTEKPRGLRERFGRLFFRFVETLGERDAADACAAAGVFLASHAHAGLDGGFLPAMARGALVVAPPRGLFPQYVTHGVSGLIEGGEIDAPPSLGEIGAAAQRVMLQARRRFVEDIERLRAFVAGEALARRTTARVDWAPAPSDSLPPPSQAREGGRRMRGLLKTDSPDAPLVTAAVVVRNARESFAPTLASILAQDYPNLEIVAVDGASTDGTRDEVAARDTKLDYWISEADKGPYDGMNRAARLARGRFLIFMNAGDFFAHESAVSEAFESEAARAADIVVGHHVYVDANGVESLDKNADFNWTYERLARGELSWEWWNGAPCGQAVFIRSELLREHPFDVSFRIAADHAFLYEARRHGKHFVHSDSVIGVYTSGGLSGANDRKTAAEILRIAQTFGPREKIDAWFKKNLPIAFG